METICTALSGFVAVKHEKTGLLVSNTGLVYMRVGGKFSKTYEWTKGSYNKQGYLRISYQGREWRVHRLVAECFIPNPENKPTVDHIDRVRDNNSVDNLRWATTAEQNLNTERVLFKGDPKVVKDSWNKANHDKILAYKKKYRDNNKEKLLAYQREYRARKRNNTNSNI